MSEPVVEVRDLTVRYDDRPVLEGVSAEMLSQHVSVILGPSGCGKTTLLKTILGLVTPASGSVRLLGADTSQLDEKGWADLRRRTGVLFQAGALLGSMTVLENVSIPLEQHTRLSPALVARIARSKLALVGLAGCEGLLPAQLSGGMRKRAAIARALALEPELLFFDEPSAGLDPVTALALDRLILDLRDRLGVTVIVVTHEPASIRRLADRILFLHEGRLVYAGSVQEAASAPEPVRHFFDAAAAP